MVKISVMQPKVAKLKTRLGRATNNIFVIIEASKQRRPTL